VLNLNKNNMSNNKLKIMNKNLKILTTLILLFFGFNVFSQSYYYDAAQIFGSNNKQSMDGVIILNDSSRIYAVVSKDQQPNPSEVILVRETNSGNILWSKKIKTSINPIYEYPGAFLQKSLNDTTFFLTINSSGNSFSYLIKIGTASGYIHYTKFMSGYQGLVAGHPIIELSNGDVIWATIYINFTQKLVLLKYDADGNPIWVKKINEINTASSYVRGIVYEQDGTFTIFGIIHNGTFFELLPFNIDTSGTVNWAYRVNAGINLFPADAIRVGNNYYVAFTDATNNKESVMKLDLNMNCVASKGWQAHPTSSTGANRIDYFGNGKIIITGVDNLVDGNLNNHEAVITMLDTSLNTVWRINNSSVCTNGSIYERSLRGYSKLAGGKFFLGGLVHQNYPAYTIIDSTGNDRGCQFVYTNTVTESTYTGVVTNTISLTTVPGIVNYATPLPTDTIFNFPQRNIICPTINPVACNSYSSPSGNHVWTSSGFYSDTIPSGTFFCDSVVLVNLTINTVDTSVTSESPTLTSNQSNASYHWLDCNSNFSPIPNDTNQVFTATANGSYAVAVTINGCTDTSACYPIINVGINEGVFENNMIIYPNPFKNSFNVSYMLEKEAGEVRFEVYDLVGRKIITERADKTQSGTVKLNLGECNGIYLLKVFADNKAVHKEKLVCLQR